MELYSINFALLLGLLAGNLIGLEGGSLTGDFQRYTYFWFLYHSYDRTLYSSGFLLV